MNSLRAHYMNKYGPGAIIIAALASFDVFVDGGHAVHLEKDGAGQWVDRSKEAGCFDCHDLAPIPKDARFMKVSEEGHLEKHEKHDARVKSRKDFCDSKGKVLSCVELKEKFRFDKDHCVVEDLTKKK